MKRLIALLVVLAAGAQIVLASSAPAEKEEPEEEQEVVSAAVAGRFDRRPPTEVGYPVEILLRMRQKLSGEYNLDHESPAQGSGHGD